MSASLVYLLDTNIVSDLVRSPRGAVSTHIIWVGEDAVCTSIIVAADLGYSAIKARYANLVEISLSRLLTH